MANSITDNRTLVDTANAVGSYVGSTSPVLDTDVTVGGGSIAEQLTNSSRYVMYNAGSPQDWSNNVFYIWINCGIVGLLATKAAGGFSIRFAGATVTDFFEFYVGGSDSWPTAVAGGWVQFVVDIEATPSNTGGTPPATTAVQHVGWAGVTGGTMTKVADNTWMDEIRRLPDGTPGIIVQGQNGGSTPWQWSDLPTQLGVLAGTAKNGPGGTVILNTPIQFFVDDATAHVFEDTVNTTVIWDNQEWGPADLYGITVLGAASGSANFTLGVKSGTGDDATGSLGTTILAASTGQRWYWDSDAANIDSCNLYGSTFVHGGDFQVDTTSNSIISCTFIDCTSATVSNSEILRCTIIDANTVDDGYFMVTDDLSDIVFSSFEFSDGHAVYLTTPRTTPQTSKGNKFAGYGAIGSTDAALFNDTAGAVQIDVTNSGDSPSYKNGTGASTNVVASTSITFTGIKTGTEVRIYRTSDDVELSGVESSGTTFTYNYNYTGDTPIYVIFHHLNYIWLKLDTVSLLSAAQSIPVQQVVERNYSNP